MASRPLEHLVLFSVVATGDREEGEESLILQLAWEIISISKNQILAKDQVYVCPGGGTPRHLPQGIDPDAIQTAGNLDSALKQFHSTLTKLGGSTFSLMTFGPNALRGLLHPQAYRICLGLQKYLHRYLDIVKEFTKAFPTTPAPTTVKDLGTMVGLSIEGEVKTGTDELTVMGQVAQKLISQGHIFHSQEIIRDDIKLDVAPDPALVKEGCVVKLRGLPFQAELKDIAGFLSGLNYIPGGIVFGINSVGRRTGEAFVVLENTEQAVWALKRHRQYLNQRYVEMYEATVEDFSRVAGGGGGGGGGASNVFVARLQGLPYRVTEDEIVEFFRPSAAVKDHGGRPGVMIVHYADGKATGDGFALFDNEADLTRALQLNKAMIGSRYVELFKSSLKEFEMVLARSGSTEEQEHFGKILGLQITPDPQLEGLKGSSKNCVKLRGIPYSATPENVIDFFGDLKEDIAVQGVHMVLNALNRPTGECFVQMKSVDAAQEASDSLHKNYIGDRYIEVFQCSGDEVFRGIQTQGTAGGLGRGMGGPYEQRGSRGNQGPRRGGGRYDDEPRHHGDRDRSSRRSGTVVKMRGLPYSSSESDITHFFSGYDVREGDVELVLNNSGRPSGIGYVTFSSGDLAAQAIREKNGKHIGSRYVELSLPY